MTQDADSASREDAFGGRFRALMANVADMVTISDRDGKILYASPATKRVSGYTPEEFMARNPFDSIHPEDRPRCKAALARLASSPGLSLELEHRVRHKNGDVRWVEGTFTSLFDDPDVGGLLATVRDITERKRADERLRESEERFRAFVAASSDVVYSISADWTEMRFLKGRDFIADTDDSSTTWIDTYIHPDDRPHVLAIIREAISTKNVFDLEHRVIRVDGSLGWTHSHAVPLLDAGGEISGWFRTARDITERKREEEKKERLRSREAAMRAEAAERERISRELHDRVAHSMGVAHQSLQLYRVLAESAPERAREKLAVAEETTKSALDQTRNLAIELRRSVAEETENGVAAALRTLLESSAPEDVETESTFSGDESLLPHDVGAQIYLVMREAIANALKHSGCEDLEASLEIHAGEVVGTITDDGDGFDPEPAPDGEHQAGIGLRSMRERAEMVGGELNLTSHPGDGTTMEIRVPLGAG
jgi:chemotaxis family two-component system sensor kinase Cph1